MTEAKSDYYLMLGPDGKPTLVDMGPTIERHRRAHVRARAGMIGQAADLLADPAFDPRETWDAAEASGMPGGMLDAAGHVAVTLAEIELRRRD